METIKYVYFGSSEFSAIILEGLYKRNYNPLLVVTKPDKPKGRGLHVAPTLVSCLAAEWGLQCFKPYSLADKQVRDALDKTNADFFIVADYGNIIPASVFNLPRFFSICVHPSLLPRYRGAAPIEYALLNGDSRTGVTIFKINEHVDAGDILLQKDLLIEKNDDYHSLRKKLALQGVDLLLEAIKLVLRGAHSLRPQDEKTVSHTRRLTKEDGRISWQQTAEAIYNRIRATVGWPSGYTYYKGKQIQILAAEVLGQPLISSGGVAVGTIVNIDKNGITVMTGRGLLKITRLKPQGKKEMSAWAFVCGYRVKAGEIFSEER